MVGLEVLDVLCAPSSARHTRFNETHDEHTHTQREGLPYRHCTWQMYKTPAGVHNSVAHHLEHPHNEGGFISREQKFVSEIFKKILSQSYGRYLL